MTNNLNVITLIKLIKYIKVCFFTNSGSEANDLALSLARIYTGNFDMLSIRNAYHGMAQSIMGANHLSIWKYPLPCG